MSDLYQVSTETALFAQDYTLDGVGNRSDLTITPNGIFDILSGPYSLHSHTPEPADSYVNQYTETPLDFRVYDTNGNLTQVSNKTAQPEWHAAVPGHGVETSGAYTLSGTIGESAYPKELNNGDNKMIVGYQQSQVGIRYMEYDYKNQLVKLTDEAGNITEYMYDALGRRIAKAVNVGQSSEKTTQYFHNGWQVVEERDGDSGQPLVWHFYGSYIDEVLASVVPGTTPSSYEWPLERKFNYHQDDLYNVVAITGGPTNVVERHEYLDYGQMIDPAAGDSAPWQLDDPAATGQLKTFTGREYDPESGYYYFRTRYMDADSGRFITRDSIGIWGDASAMGNGYTFLASSPLNYLDPMGEDLYAVDGTWASWGEGTNTEMFYRNTKGTKRYWNGPSWGATGADAMGIVNGVKSSICDNYCKNIKSNKRTTIDMVGWSRGGATVLTVADRLRRKGCCCVNGVYNPEACGEKSSLCGVVHRGIPIRWIGLFDAVKMSLFLDDVTMKPGNVSKISHAIKTKKQLGFPTMRVLGAKEKLFKRYDGTRTSHGDIGRSQSNNDSYHWIVREAIGMGVPVTAMRGHE